VSGRPDDRDRLRRDRTANAEDRWGKDPYARRRSKQARDRARDERRHFDPRPPTDDDWTLADEDERLRIMRRPTPIGEALEGFVRRQRWEGRVHGATVFSRWAEIVGDDLARRCEPVRLANGNLLIRAESQAWATQLTYMLGHLADKGNAVLGEGFVRQVSVVVGPLQGTAAPLDD
jgi:predicted nucleic acid-binding Zn ribbon protein